MFSNGWMHFFCKRERRIWSANQVLCHNTWKYDYYDSPGCSRLWPLSEVSHCSHEPETYIKYFSTFSEYLLFSEDLIWFDFWLLFCSMYYSGISIGPGSCMVLHCHSHNYSKTDFVIKSNQNWSSKNGCQNHYFSWWLCVTTLSHEWLLHLLSKKTDFDDWTYQIWNLNLVWMSFFLNNPPAVWIFSFAKNPLAESPLSFSGNLFSWKV